MSKRKHTGDVTTVPLSDWQEHVSMLSARELYLAGDMLASMSRHPANAGRRAWRGAVADRLAVVTAEQDRRWLSIWSRNVELSDELTRIYLFS